MINERTQIADKKKKLLKNTGDSKHIDKTQIISCLKNKTLSGNLTNLQKINLKR